MLLLLVAKGVRLLCNPMNCNLPGSSVHGISQARILGWVAVSFSRGTFLTQGSNPRLPSSSVVKNPPASAEDMGSIPGVEKIPWRRKWQPTLVFLPWKSHGQRSLGGYNPWGHKRVRHNFLTKHLVAIKDCKNLKEEKTLFVLW